MGVKQIEDGWLCATFTSWRLRDVHRMPTLTAVDAYSKKGNSPEDHRARSRSKPSDYGTLSDFRAAQRGGNDTHPENSEYVRVHVQCPLVYSVWQCRV